MGEGREGTKTEKALHERGEKYNNSTLSEDFATQNDTIVSIDVLMQTNKQSILPVS
jgi:hypothetical protein